MSTNPGQIDVDADPALGEVRSDRAYVADHRVLRERVDRVVRHRHETGERGRGDDRAAGAHGLLEASHAEDDAVDVDAEHPAVSGEVVPRATDAGVEECEVDGGGDRVPCVRIGDVEAGREIERQHCGAFLLEQARRPRRRCPKRCQSRARYGTRTTLPTCLRSSISRWASAASARGYSAPTTGLIAPALQSSSSSACSRGHDVGTPRHQPAEVEALDAHVPADEQRRVELLPPAAGVADADERAQRRQDADTRREELAADGIEHEIRLHRVGELVVAVRLLGTELHAEAALLLGRGGGHHARAEVARDLDGRRAHAAGAGVDEHSLAGLEAHLARDGNPGREEGEQERGALRERRARPAAGTAARSSTATCSA